MSALPASLVYTGFWVDWSKGPVFGSTLTVRTSTGSILVAFLALYTSFVGRHTWELICFSTHQLRSRYQSADGLHWQQQAILRNNNSPNALISNYTQLALRWRRFIKSSNRSGLLILPLAFLCSIGFSLAGIYSSRVVSTADINVLAKSPARGNWDRTNNTGSWLYQQEERYLAETVASQWHRANECFGKATTVAECDIYFKQQLQWESRYNTSSPFAEKISANPRLNQSIQLDTGIMSSHSDFGINVPKQHRIGFRKRTICTPLDKSKYITLVEADKFHFLDREPLPGEQIVISMYGNGTSPMSEDIIWISTYQTNTTFTYSTSSDLWIRELSTLDNFLNGPVPELRPSNGDLSLIYISGNSVKYLRPVNDPVFSAHRKLRKLVITSVGNMSDLYLTDNIMNTIACNELYQFCSSDAPRKARCTDLNGIFNVYQNLSRIAPLTTIQKKTIDLFASSIMFWGASIGAGANAQNSPLLKVAQHLNSKNMVLGLPDDQWVREVEGWEALVLAMLQQFMADFSTGPSQPYGKYREYLRSPTTKAGRRLRHSMKMKTKGSFSNINVLSFGLIMGMGGIVIAINLSLERVFVHIHHHKRGGLPRVQAWLQDGALNLQKKAYEGYGYTEWIDDRYSTVPVTKTNAMLPALQTIEKCSDSADATDSSVNLDEQNETSEEGGQTETSEEGGSTETLEQEDPHKERKVGFRLE